MIEERRRGRRRMDRPVALAVGLGLLLGWLGAGALASRGWREQSAGPSDASGPLYLALGDSLATGAGASEP